MRLTISTILVGLDFSEPADAALERAIAIAQQHGAKIVLVHAQANDAAIGDVDNAILEQLGEVSAAVHADAARQIAARLEMIQQLGIACDLISRVGPADEVLSNASTETGAELIALGSHGHTGITHMLLGSVAASTIRHATCDVLVCRGTAQRSLFTRPLVATDFSPSAAKTLGHATSVTVPGTPLKVVHAWQLPVGSWGATLLGQARFPWSTVRDAVLSGAQTQADRLVEANRELGVPVEVELVQGPPAQVITQAAERHGSDLIAIGAHGHRGFRRLLLGSVAENTIRHSPCSVLVVHGEPKH